MSAHNLSGLFYSTTAPSYVGNIKLSQSRDQALKEARNELRAALRDGFSKSLASRMPGMESARLRFFTQGSYSYGTIIDPLRPPEHQADLDEGVYLPLSAFEEAPPAEMAQAYIEATDEILMQLAAQKSWTFSDRNPNCSRVSIGNDKHIDIPRYAIPDSDFRKLIEKAANERRIILNEAPAAVFDDDWRVMPNKVQLAHRDEGWKPSDPRPFKDWVDEVASYLGPNFKRIVKILKGWRDYQEWPSGGPKSILLTVAVERSLANLTADRLDIALSAALNSLPTILAGPVLHPTDGHDLSERLDEDGIRAGLCSRLQSLSRSLNDCISGQIPRAQVCSTMRRYLGDRFPDDSQRIAADTVRGDQKVSIASVPSKGSQHSA